MNYTKMLLVPYNKKILEIYEPTNNELKEKLIKYNDNIKKSKKEKPSADLIDENLSNQKKLLVYRNNIKTNVVKKDKKILNLLEKKSISNKQKLFKHNQLITKLKKIKNEPINVDQETQTDLTPIDQNLYNQEPKSLHENNILNPLAITSNNDREKIDKKNKVKKFSIFTNSTQYFPEAYDDDIEVAPKRKISNFKDIGTFTKKFSNPNIINTRSMKDKWVEF